MSSRSQEDNFHLIGAELSDECSGTSRTRAATADALAAAIRLRLRALSFWAPGTIEALLPKAVR